MNSMNCFTEEQLSRISYLVAEIEKLSDIEKLFLYLQLPCGRVDRSEGSLKHNSSKLGSDLFSRKPDQETTQTYTWILSHLEVDPNVSLPKQEVYDEYKTFCQANRFEPLCVADFGKAMKHAFPCIKPRRLGQRGNSRYCYSGLRKKYKIQAPILPNMIEPTFCMDNDCSQAYNQIIRDCEDNPNECPLRKDFNNCGVMNLKVESGGEQQCNGGHAATYGDVQIPNRQVGYHNRQAHHDSHMSISNPINDGLILSQVNRVPTSDYVPNQQASVPMNGCNGTECSYRSVIKPPGTPDDDDYRHNYQDSLPMHRQMFTTTLPVSHSGESSSMGSYQQACRQQVAAKTTQSGGDGACSSTSLPANCVGQDSGQNGGQNHLLNPLTSYESASSSSILQANMVSNSNHLTLLNINNADSFASPFQSPSSTPYSMCSYVNHDLTDYYSDCVRYSS